ncbi:T3SS (YopN, CesT) and YbjN peptide-binding chaperone 1 [Micromonospora zhanjiangensis]|uniref:Sensory transduction regulator n=1 Tax=Micromonospora zhanjiangensis TaxID=1522057 RepID=A0ABV8KKP3_9ACTN
MTAENTTAPGAGRGPVESSEPKQAESSQPKQVEPSEAHELILLDEPSNADLRGKVIEAWQEFARALAGCLRTLPTGANIELTLDPTASGTGDAVYSVSVEVGADGQIGARAVGNAVLPAGFRLDRAAVADMVALGWSPPGVIAGSGEHFGLRGSTGDAGKLATTISRTLRDVYGAPHPAFLVYLAHDARDETLPVAPLGTARAEVAPDENFEADLDEALAAAALATDGDDDEVLSLDERVRTVVSAMLKSEPERLQVDSDGDINIRAGSAMVFVRVRDNPPLVDVFSPVLTEIEPTEQLYVKLSELTNRMPIGRLYCTQDTVWASIPVFGRNFQATHLMLAVQVMTGLADELDDRLLGEFGGKRFFGEGDKPAHRDPGEHRTGMYL